MRTLMLTLTLLLLGAIKGAPLLAQTPVPTDDPALQIREFDVIVLTNGKRFEGEITEDRPDVLVFRDTRGIISRFAADTIRERLLKNPPDRVYSLRKRRYFDEESVADQRALAEWCLSSDVGLSAEGIFHFEEAARLAPTAGELYDTLLDLYRQRSEFDRDARALDRELALSYRGVEAGFGGAELRLHTGQLFAETGDDAGAVRVLLPFADQDASSPAVESGQDLLIGLLDDIDRRDDARRLVDTFLADENRTSKTALQRYSAEWLLADVAASVPGAKEAFEEMIEDLIATSPNDGKAHLWRGCYAMLQSDQAGARASLKRAFELGEVGAEAALTIALNFARSGESEQALELVEMARPAAGVTELVQQVEAYTQENIGDHEFAAALWREACQLEGASWQTWVLALQARSRLEKGFAFDREVRRALDKVGSNPAAFAELALLIGDRALSAGEGEEARRWLGYARAAGRGLPEILLRVGLAHLAEGGDLRVAREVLSEALDRAPGDPDLQNAYGCLEYRSGNLLLARDRFQLVTSLVPAEGDAEEVPANRAYAIAALEQIDRTLGEEVWVDEFLRPDGAQVLNNWEKSETYGITIELRGGNVRFGGTQQFESDGLTKLVRMVDGSTLARVRASLTISPRTKARIGIRLAQSEGSEEGDGIVVFRDLDGTIAVAINSSDESQVIRSDGSGDELEPDHKIIPTKWPTDGKPHWLELRLPRESAGETSASIYLDGQLVMSGIRPIRLRSRGSSVVGVSGQAALTQDYGFEVTQFEVFRRVPRNERNSSNR